MAARAEVLGHREPAASGALLRDTEAPHDAGRSAPACHTDDVASAPSRQPALTGSLLVASPLLDDPNFARSVVLMLHHDLNGGQGVVLNRQLTDPVDAVLPGWQAVTTAPQTLFQGGPVQTDSAIGIVTVPGDGGEPLGIRKLFGGIGVVDLDAPPVLVAPEVAGMRVFAGYAGWGAGQLEREIRRGDWSVVEAEARDAFCDQPDQLWERVLRRQRGPLAFLALYPDDPSLN